MGTSAEQCPNIRDSRGESAGRSLTISKYFEEIQYFDIVEECKNGKLITNRNRLSQLIIDPTAPITKQPKSLVADGKSANAIGP